MHIILLETEFLYYTNTSANENNHPTDDSTAAAANVQCAHL